MESFKRTARPLDPSNPAYRWKLWVNLGSRPGELRHIFWGKICWLLAFLAVAGWFGATGLAWAQVKYHRRFSNVRYVDLAFPWRWGNYRTAIAAQYLEAGKAALLRGRPDEALGFLNASLAMAPHSLESRRLTGIAQFQMGYRSAALSTVRAGITAGGEVPSEEYLNVFFDMAFAQQADDEVVAAGRLLLPARPDQTRLHRLVAFKVAMANYYRGRYIEAERILGDWKMHEIAEGEILFASCEAEMGLPEQAARRLQYALQHFEATREIHVALVKLAVARGRPAEERTYALLRKLAEPENPGPRIELLRADHKLGLAAEERREIDSFCRDFRKKTDAPQMLAEFAGDTGNVGAAERAREWARELKQQMLGFDVYVARAAIVAGDYSSALGALEFVQIQKTPLSRLGDATVTGMKAVALFGARGGAAEHGFADLLPMAGFIRPADDLFLVRELRRVGHPEHARELLERAAAANPDDEPLLEEVIRTDAAANDRAGLVANLPRFLSMRRPPRDVLEACLPLLAGKKDVALRGRVTDAFARSPVMPGIF